MLYLQTKTLYTKKEKGNRHKGITCPILQQIPVAKKFEGTEEKQKIRNTQKNNETPLKSPNRKSLKPQGARDTKKAKNKYGFLF